MNRLWVERTLGCCIFYLFMARLRLQFCSKTSSQDIPLLLWWTKFPNEVEIISCTNGHRCKVSGNLIDYDSVQLRTLLFYGTYLELKNLPVRKPHIKWALFHEESPKNLPALRNTKLQQLFNLTATFSRHSSFPLTLQYLRDLQEVTSNAYVMNVSEKNRLIREDNLATVLYMQSDCDTPIGRDEIVMELMRFVRIDSVGACLNNKVLPERLKLNGSYDLYANDLMTFVARYKFVVAIENARCDDYITEKLWRPLIVGAIPIYLGSHSVNDWLPNEQSAILIDDHSSIESLAKHIHTVNQDDELYNSYLCHKLHGRIANKRLKNALASGTYGHQGNFVDSIPAFQCFICDSMYSNHLQQENKENVYNCEEPRDKSWSLSWRIGWEEANQSCL